VLGGGQIFCKGDINLEGKSQVSVKPDKGVAIYAEGDINLKPMSIVDDDDSGMADKINKFITTGIISYVEDALSNGQVPSHITIGAKDLKDFIRNVLDFSTNWGGHSNENFRDYIKRQYPDVDDKDISTMIKTLIQNNSYISGNNIVIDTFSLQNIFSSESKKIDPHDMTIKGLVYTRKNFSADTGGYNLSITGSLIVNGISPDGNLIVSNGKNVVFSYDPSYLKLLFKFNPTASLKKLFWANF